MSSRFEPVVPGSALPSGAPAPATARAVPRVGGAENPSAAALRQKFGAAVKRVDVVWGESNVVVDAASVHDVIRWLHDDASQRYDYLSDVTAVEFRDFERPIEVVWHLRSLPRAFGLWVAVDDHATVRGTAGSAAFGATGSVIFVNTNPDWRRRGVARAMTAIALRTARHAGETTSALFTRLCWYACRVSAIRWG